MSTPADPEVVKLGAEMLQFTSSLDQFETLTRFSTASTRVTVKNLHINVLGAALFPVRWGGGAAPRKARLFSCIGAFPPAGGRSTSS